MSPRRPSWGGPTEMVWSRPTRRYKSPRAPSSCPSRAGAACTKTARASMPRGAGQPYIVFVSGFGLRYPKRQMTTPTGLTRRAFLKVSASAAAAGLAGCSLPGDGTTTAAAAKRGPVPLSGAEAYNYILGTQTIGATYQFTGEDVLVETAQAILDMGSNLLKFTMGRDYQRMKLKPSKAAYPETMQYLLNQGSDARNAP